MSDQAGLREAIDILRYSATGARSCCRCKSCEGRAKKAIELLKTVLAVPSGPAPQQWPICKWCHTDLERWVQQAGKCPKCGAIDFMEPQPCPDCGHTHLSKKECKWGLGYGVRCSCERVPVLSAEQPAPPCNAPIQPCLVHTAQPTQPNSEALRGSMDVAIGQMALEAAIRCREEAVSRALQSWAEKLRTALAQPNAGAADYTLVPNSALRWLFGEEGDFGEAQSNLIRPKYWWRSEFRKRMLAGAAPQGEKR